MISKSAVEKAVHEWLEGKEYFLVEINISADDRIEVLIDHAEGVWIEDCADLSRYIESQINREDEDYELEVGSAGIGQPFKVLQQYVNSIGYDVELLTADGKKMEGTLLKADEEGFAVGVLQKVKVEGKKRPQTLHVRR